MHLKQRYGVVMRLSYDPLARLFASPRRQFETGALALVSENRRDILVRAYFEDGQPMIFFASLQHLYYKMHDLSSLESTKVPITSLGHAVGVKTRCI